MEISTLNAYRDYYNLLFGYNIQTANLLMISDLVTAEAANMPDFFAQIDDFQNVHIGSGLEALLARQVVIPQ